MITLQTPFLYNPADGNLLIEIRNYQPIPPPYFPPTVIAGVLDAWETTIDTISRVYAHDVNATNGIADTLGLSTEFLVTPLPELSISLQSSNLLFRWVIQEDTFRLQQSSTVGPAATWQPAGGTISTNRAYVEAKDPLFQQTTARFFRLVATPSSPITVGGQTGAGTILIPDQKR